MTHKRRVVVELEITGGTPCDADAVCDALGPKLGPWLRDRLTETVLPNTDLALVDFKVTRERWVPYESHIADPGKDLFGWHRTKPTGESHDSGR